MAKKKERRPNLPEEALARARAELANEGSAPVSAPKKTDKPAPKIVTKPTYKAVSIDDLKAEYTHVIRDMTSMGILAALLFAGLVVASLIFV